MIYYPEMYLITHTIMSSGRELEKNITQLVIDENLNELYNHFEHDIDNICMICIREDKPNVLFHILETDNKLDYGNIARQCVSYNRTNIIKILIAEHFDKFAYKLAPSTCYKEKKDIFKMLLDAGLNPNYKNGYLIKRAAASSIDLFKLLLDYGADLSLCAKDIFEPAFMTKNLEVMKILLESGFDLTSTYKVEFESSFIDDDLMDAIDSIQEDYDSHKKMCEYLLMNGINAETIISILIKNMVINDYKNG